MSALSFKRRRLLEEFAAAKGEPSQGLTAFEAHLRAFSDYSVGPRWREKKTLTVFRMAAGGLVAHVGQDNHGEPTWAITDKARAALAKAGRQT